MNLEGAYQSTNITETDLASSHYHDYVSLHFQQVVEASASFHFAEEVQETEKFSLLTEAIKFQVRYAAVLILVRRTSNFGGEWKEIGSQTPQEPPSMKITQYNRSGCLACFVQSTSSAELSAVGFLATASDQLKIFIIQEPQEAHSPSGSIMIIPSRTTGFPYFRSGRRVIKHSKILQR